MAILFIILFAAMIIGVPIGFSIALAAMVYLGMDGTSLVIVVQRIVNGGASFTLLALPLFIFAGNLMFYGCTPRLINLANLLVRRLPGGMGIIGVLSSAFFGAVSGSGVATVAAIGSIVEPEMLRQNYGKGFTASLVAASGTLGVLIPPSIMAVLYASCAGTSVAKQLLAGVGPGILVMLCLIALNVWFAIVRGYGRTTEPVEKHTFGQNVKILLDAVPPLMMPLIILGGILTGVITPTESAVIAVVYALLLSMLGYRELKPNDLVDVTVKSVVTSAVILFIMSAATPFAWVLTVNNVASEISEAMFALSESPFVIVSLILIFILIMGTFMESCSITILVVPILLPIMTELGYDPMHFGTILILAVTIGAVTPPLAVALYTACSIIKIRIEETIPDVLYVIGALVVGLVFVTLFPQISLWMPGALL